MSRQVKLRFVITILLSWLVAAWWAATTPIPESILVGQRQTRVASGLTGDLAGTDVEAAGKALEKVLMWGILRDGKPIPPPVNEAEVRKKVEWRLVASVIRPGERYILIRVAGEAPIAVKEGAALPDGSSLLKVESKSITLRLPDGKRHKQPTAFD